MVSRARPPGKGVWPALRHADPARRWAAPLGRGRCAVRAAYTTPAARSTSSMGACCPGTGSAKAYVMVGPSSTNTPPSLRTPSGTPLTSLGMGDSAMTFMRYDIHWPRSSPGGCSFISGMALPMLPKPVTAYASNVSLSSTNASERGTFGLSSRNLFSLALSPTEMKTGPTTPAAESSGSFSDHCSGAGRRKARPGQHHTDTHTHKKHYTCTTNIAR
mmetsp:Transcript_35940/g.90649  ORF Transcript_35940/g.90649 Transcript_35940/m.90649 type:complete len:217 (-) Transcript_35940:33-683(-)